MKTCERRVRTTDPRLHTRREWACVIGVDAGPGNCRSL